MIKKLQLVVLGVVVLQAANMSAMGNGATNASRHGLTLSTDGRKAVKHPVKTGDGEKHAKRKCMHLTIPGYILTERRDWEAELKKNPDLAWLPI